MNNTTVKINDIVIASDKATANWQFIGERVEVSISNMIPDSPSQVHKLIEMHRGSELVRVTFENDDSTMSAMFTFSQIMITNDNRIYIILKSENNKSVKLT
ncbi:hypothetical protein JLT2_10 [Paraglaciecola Antarctic JLT virus 2]|nr:hypothetical protein JLT2_10 [Paraglaciecola Antarctic JLT virus 2]